MNVQTLLTRARAAADSLAPVAPLMTRLVIGEAFVLTGLGKLGHLDRTTAFFASIGLPLPGVHAVLVGVLELVGGACLMLGLGTRLFSALLAGTMGVALLTADRGALLAALVPGAAKGLTDIAALVFLMFLLWLVGSGAGPLSVDRLLARRAAGTGR